MHENVGKVVSGFTCCPACLVDGIPQEERMALPGSDHRVTCLSCQRVTSEMPHDLAMKLHALPASIKAAVLGVSSWNSKSGEELVGVYRLFHLSTRGLGFSAGYDEVDAQRASATVAQGHGQTLLTEAERVTIKLSLSTVRREDTVELTYLPDDLQSMEDACVDMETALANVLDAPGITPPRAKAVRELVRCGFRVRHIDTNSAMARILLVNNRDHDSRFGGAQAEIKWLNV